MRHNNQGNSAAESRPVSEANESSPQCWVAARGEQVKTYELRTIQDLLQVPIERREACLREIEYCLALHDLVVGSDTPNVGIGVIRWKDDGDKSVQLTDQGGREILTLQVTDKQPKQSSSATC